MRDVSSRAMKIFIGHAKEDTKIAEAIAAALRAAFPNYFGITMMSKFPLGANWRKLIAESVRSADIMICIATGRLKPSHSFTGMEVGVFEESLVTTKRMTHFNALDRKMIPFAVLARVPETIDDYQGIDLDADDIIDVRFDEENLQDDVNKFSSNLNASHEKVLKFLTDLDDIWAKAFNIDRSDSGEMDQRRTALRQMARNLAKDIFQAMLGKEKRSVPPQPRITIRTPPSHKANPNLSIVEQSVFRAFGNCREAFGMLDTEGAATDWKAFAGKTTDAIRFEWNKIFKNLLTSPQSDSLNDNCITSYDGKSKFRVFVSKVTEFYGNDKEAEFYIVKILKGQDLGDKRTTMLLKALEISLRFRYMFLEEDGAFSPFVFKTDGVDQIKDRASSMIDELTSVLLAFQESGLDDPRFIFKLLGKDESTNLDGKRKRWDEDKNALQAAADRLMALQRVTLDDKERFVKVVEDFRENTLKGNQEYVVALSSALQSCIAGQQRCCDGHAPQVIDHAPARAKRPTSSKRKLPTPPKRRPHAAVLPHVAAGG